MPWIGEEFRGRALLDDFGRTPAPVLWNGDTLELLAPLFSSGA
jgi:hypothetical protein